MSQAHGDDVAGPIQFRLLGPIEATYQRQNIYLGEAKHRLILAILLANTGRAIPMDSLITMVWDDFPPAMGRSALYSYISQLRRNLDRGVPGAAGILPASKSGYYQADLDPSQVDLHRFRALGARARECAGRDDEEAVRLFRESLGQWGTTGGGLQEGEQALAGLPGRWADGFRMALEAERRALLIERINLELRLGRHHQVIPELTAYASTNPVDEQAAALLMTALYRNGHQAAALDAYRRMRDRLNQELGITPGKELEELFHSILRHDDVGLSAQATREPPMWRASGTERASRSSLNTTRVSLGRTRPAPGPGRGRAGAAGAGEAPLVEVYPVGQGLVLGGEALQDGGAPGAADEFAHPSSVRLAPGYRMIERTGLTRRRSRRPRVWQNVAPARPLSDRPPDTPEHCP